MRQPCLRERDEEGHGQVRDGLLVHHPHRARQDHVHHAHARVARGQAHIAPRHFLFGFSARPPPPPPLGVVGGVGVRPANWG